MIVVNFKNYVFGKKAIELSKNIEKINKKVIVCPSFLDINKIIDETNLRVYAQHIDFSSIPEKSTGFITAENLVKYRVRGSLINHSEHKIPLREVSLIINKCKLLKFDVIVCVMNLREVKKIISLKPFAIAYENPELISTGKSVTRYDKVKLKRFIKLVDKTNIIPLCGAGISSREDVKSAYALGFRGVLISSAITKDKKLDILK
ncbi:MAG: triose-phosphate isomerase [Candidatus Pacearchaeota archaeon]